MKKQQKQIKKAFTLVELIVVISILVILATIGFVGFKNFIKDSRDGNRIATLKNIENGLALYRIKTNKYPKPEGDIIQGEINGKILLNIGEIGDINSKLINLNKAVKDPLTGDNYKYGTDARYKYYEIASVLESDIAYKSLITKTYADTDYQAKVNGNYPGYIKFNSGSELWIANIPGLIFNNTGSIDLLSSDVYYVVDKGQNLPYKIDGEIIQNTQADDIIKQLTKSQIATLTGVNITGITQENFSNYFTGATLESFNINKIDLTNQTSLIETVKQIVFGSSLTQYNSCDTLPNYTDAIFTVGTPSKQNQEWQSISEVAGCYWTCGAGKVLLGNNCVSENCSGETPDGTIKVGNAASTAGGTWHYSATPGVCTYTCGTNYTENAGNCEPSTRANQACTGLIANAVWNSANQITQTWSGTLSEWTPTLTGSYNETTSTTECRYKCDSGYIYDTDTSTCKQDKQYSLMFDSTQSQYLSRNFSTPTNQNIWTLSLWVKRTKLGLGGTSKTFLLNGTNGGSNESLFIDGNDKLAWTIYNGSSIFDFRSNATLRDTSAWYHVVITKNTSTPTIYINNIIQTGATSGSLSQIFINTAITHNIGQNGGGTVFEDGYRADTYFIDGQALSPSDFGQIDSLTSQWIPKKYTGTYGNNGFYLDFSDGANLGKDKAGTNNWAVNGGITQVDNQFIDHPTNNFTTLNPLRNTLFASISNKGNLGFSTDTPTNGGVTSTMNLPKSGKWYFEVTFTNNGSKGRVSLCDSDTNSLTSGAGYYGYKGVDGVTYSSSGVGPTLSTYTTNDTIGVAVDRDNGKMWFRKNGNWQGGGTPDPSTGASPNFSSITYENLCVAFSDEDSITSVSGISNFGQGGQSGLTYYPNAGGYFKYPPPTGFKALSTKNLPEPTIKKPNEHFDVALYDGNAGTKNITGLSFKPDLVWIKGRLAATYNNNILVDSVRGIGKILQSNQTVGEGTTPTSVTSFNTDGFSLGGFEDVNTNLNKYVSWNWKAGTISGFDIIRYTGNGTNKVISHNLNAIPKMAFVKEITGTRNWFVYHNSLGPTKTIEGLNTTSLATIQSSWNNTSPTSTGFTLGPSNPGTNTNLNDFIAYLWSEVPGFSKFGSYTGNGSIDGPFVYTGFRPKYVMIKRTDSTGPWIVYDTKRDEYNKSYKEILLNSLTNENNITENISGSHDILSNGFKVRSASTDTNYAYENFSGGTYIYAAFAEAPFKYANAR